MIVERTGCRYLPQGSALWVLAAHKGMLRVCDDCRISFHIGLRIRTRNQEVVTRLPKQAPPTKSKEKEVSKE